MLPQACRSHDDKIIPSLSWTNIKWLNVVMDLKGILCVCQERRLMQKGQAYVDSLGIHSSIDPSPIVPKAIFVRPFCQRFFKELGNVVDITIWSSMRVATAKFVCNLVFWRLPPPINILEQESNEEYKYKIAVES
jgi:hypothetical protein